MEALVATVMSILAPYLVKGAEAFAKETGKEAFKRCKAVIDRLGKWWNADPLASAAAQGLPAAPERNAKVLAQLLAEALQKDAAFAAELRQLVDEAEPTIEVVQRIAIAHDLTGADIGELVRGHVRVEQHAEYAEHVTGVKIDRVGGD